MTDRISTAEPATRRRSGDIRTIDRKATEQGSKQQEFDMVDRVANARYGIS